MTFPSPIQELLEQYKLELSSYNETTSREGAASGEFQTQLLSEFISWGDGGCWVLATTGIVELEYAAIQKSTGVFDASCRGTIELTGEDRLDCIGRMTTQKLSDMVVGESRLAFMTSRKGTIVADIVVHILADRIMVDLDVTAVQSVCDYLNSYIVMEDVNVQNKTDSVHWLWCIGPEAKTVDCSGAQTFSLPTELLGLDGIAIASTPSEACGVWSILVNSGVRPVGWYALNMARVELGIPIFMIDFDSSNLPHETSLLSSRVSFDKGCYLGQEIVARMESLGQPKQKIVKLKMSSDDLPIAGSQLWSDGSASGTPVGVVTSSAISPLGGSVPAVLAMVIRKCNSNGSSVFTHVGTSIIEGTVEPI